MNRSSSINNNKKNLSALASLCLASLLAMGSISASAQSLVSSASPEELIQMLGGGGGALTRKFSYKPTQAPEAGTNKCSVGGVAKSAAMQQRLAVVAPSDSAVYTSDETTPGKLDLKISFRSGTDQLEASSTGLLNNLAVALNSPALQSSMLAVAGHTDAEGDNTQEGRRKNLELSCARAIAVRNFLITLGVDGTRLGIYGFGPGKPIEQGVIKSEINRRVEIRRAS